MKKSDLALSQERSRTEVATETWISVVRAYHECTATLAKRLNPLGLSILQHEILMNLQMSPGLTQRQLSERCFSAKSGISMIVKHFEADRTVVRTRSPKDSRAWNLSLTLKGQILAQRASEEQVRVVLGMASPYAPDELLRLKERMDQSADRMQTMRQDHSADSA